MSLLGLKAALPPKSNLSTIGAVLILVGAGIAPLLARQIDEIPEGVQMGAALLADGLRLGIFLGIALIIIGLFRNRKMQRLSAQANAGASRDVESADGAK